MLFSALVWVRSIFGFVAILVMGAIVLGISDTGRIQQILFLPYWLWGAIMAVGSIFILITSLRIAYRS